MSRRPAKVTQADIARAIRAESVVYFVVIGKHVKIGFTTNLPRRLKAFMTTTLEVELLICIPGDRTLEQTLHKRLVDARAGRELFRRDWRVQGFIDNYAYGGMARGIQWLDETTPQRQKQKRIEERAARTSAARQSKAELDAHYARLVA